MSPNHWAAHGMSTIFLGAGSAKRVWNFKARFENRFGKWYSEKIGLN